MRLKNVLALLLGATLLCSALLGCGTSSSSSTPVSSAPTSSSQAAAEHSKGLDLSGTEIFCMMEGHPSDEGVAAQLHEFMDETGIKVNLEVIPFADLSSKALLMLSQKSDQYDIIFYNNLIAESYVKNDYLLPYDEYLKDPELSKYYDEADFVPGYIDLFRIEGKLYALPMYGESNFMMYRKDLFERFNLKVPETFDELYDCAKAIYEGTNGEIYGITLRGSPDMQNMDSCNAFIWGYGGRHFNEKNQLDLDTPEAIAGVDMYARILRDFGPPGVSNFQWTENRLAFTNGQAGIIIDATVNGAYNEDPNESKVAGLVGYAQIPTQVSKDKLKGNNCSLIAHGLYINNYISEERKKASVLFATWATNKDIQAKTQEIEPFCATTSLSAMKSPIFTEKYAPFIDAMVDAINRGNPNYYATNPKGNELISLVSVAVSQVVAGQKTAEEAMKGVTEQVNSTILANGFD